MKTVNMTVVKMVVSKDKHSVYWRAVLMVSKRAAAMVSYSADPRVDLKVVLKAHKTAEKLVE